MQNLGRPCHLARAAAFFWRFATDRARWTLAAIIAVGSMAPKLRDQTMRRKVSVRRLMLAAVMSLAGLVACGAPTAPEESATPAPPAEAAAKPRIIVGRVEWVVLQDAHLRIKARIDTGAGISSVNAKILEIKQEPDGDHVRFQLQDAEGHTKILQRKVVGWANIKVMGSDEKNRRPIVRLDVCIGGKQIEGRVNLNDRSNYLYPMLVGRNLLNTGKFLVDPGALYLHEPGCE
jgi:hypothetical protein